MSRGSSSSSSSSDDEGGLSELIGTPDHPFWSITHGGFTGLGELEEGEIIAFSDGEGVVESVKYEYAASGKEFTVYNFEVEDFHTYFVAPINATSSDNFVWVHNDCVWKGRKKKTFDEARREAFDKAGLIDSSKVKMPKFDKKTGTAVEFKGPGEAKVGYDGLHSSPGPHHDSQHISWQSAGKRGSGGAQEEISRMMVNNIHLARSKRIKMIDEDLIDSINQYILNNKDVCKMECFDEDAFLERLIEKFNIDINSLWWWDATKLEKKVINYSNIDPFVLIKKIIGNNEKVFLFVTDDEFPPWPVYSGRLYDILELIGEQRFFEYFIVDPDENWMLFDTHENNIVVLNK